MKFTWLDWDFDGNGCAYIIAKKECPKIENVLDYICKNDMLQEECKKYMIVEEGWCKYQVRSDWDNSERGGGYVVEQQKDVPTDLNEKKKPGWFPVWIIRKGDWYEIFCNGRRSNYG